MIKKVDIIIINWNSGQSTLRAIQPYLKYQSNKIICNIIIVDNGSSDNSKDLLEGIVSNTIFNNINLGFAQACNQGYAKCIGDYILLLNPDTESKTSVLETLVDFLETHNNYGAIGPAQVNEKGEILKTCGRFPTFLNSLSEVLGLSKIFPQFFQPNYIMQDWDHLTSKTVEHVMGSYMLIRRSVVLETGFMDENYFVYMDDIDLSRRINRAGFKIYYDASVSIYHQGRSTGEKMYGVRLFYFLRSRAVYWRKNFNSLSVFVLIALSVFIEPLLRLLETVFIKNKMSIKEMGISYGKYYMSLVQFTASASNK